MENNNIDKKSHTPLIIIGAVVVLLVAGLTYGYVTYFADNEEVNTNTTVAMINTSNQNVNGVFVCESDSDCPDNYRCITTIDTGGKEQKVCDKSSDLNNNINAGINVNASPAVVSGWQTIKYQKADHGLQFDVPNDWNTYSGGMGLKEGDGLAGASYYEEGTGGVNVATNYYNNTESSFADWLTKHKEGLVLDGERIVKEETVGNFSVIKTEETTGEYSYSDYNGYISKNGKVYRLSMTGGGEQELSIYADVFTDILESFSFIDPLPLVSISGPSEKTRVGEDSGYALTVNWLSVPEPQNMNDPMLTDEENFIYRRDYYKVGTVTNGRYANQSLLVLLEAPEGPAFQDTVYRVIYNSTDQTFTYLTKYTDDLSYVDTAYTYDSDSTIPDLELPDTISIPDSSLTLAKELFNPNDLFSTYTDLKTLFTDSSVGNVYLDSSGDCYLVEAPDHLVTLYHINLDFIKNTKDREYAVDSTQFVPNITWSDSTVNTAEYTYNEPTGCGSRDCQTLFTAEQLGGIDALKVIGETANGDVIYGLQNNDHEKYKDTYEYSSIGYEEEQVSYEKYLLEQPLFYWQDPFGYYVQFKKVEFLPMVECGKPVIYLYPKTEMAVNVKVEPNGGFSITEPEYPSDGWSVTAYPDGSIKNEDGAYYPYLFWEGVGMNYLRPNKGFVVPVSEVETLLDEKLSLLGMVDNEIADFKEFWLPRMQAAPYYFVTFVDQAVFDQLAPLTVTPRADSVIRVFMDYQPLAGPISVQPLAISTPVRHGFTVVEWGGALHE
ncbi:MAG: hypothetical protein V1838_05605 [Patescibacteria group bacterium]